MKRILVAIAIGLLFAACQQNTGAGYDTVTPEEMVSNAATYDASRKAPMDVSRFKKGHVVSVNRYGKKYEVCTSYFGEFNGHTWYVFYDNLASPSVVHDPLCECKPRNRVPVDDGYLNEVY